MSERNPGWSEWSEEPDDRRSTVFGPAPRRQPVPEPPPTYPQPQAYPPDPTRQYPPPAGPGPVGPAGPSSPYGGGAYAPQSPYATQAYPAAPPAVDRRPRRSTPPPTYDELEERGRRAGRRSRDESGGGLPFGAGLVFGLGGLVCFLLALLVLPWFEAGGQEVTLADIRESFTLAATDPGDLPGAPGETPSTLPEGVPSADDVQAVVEDQVRASAAEAAASAIDSGRSRYLELYTDALWIAVAAGVALAVVFSTILAPRSWALSLLLGFRRLSGLVVVLAGVVHGVALWVVFTGDGAPDPAFGVWLGLGGLAGVLMGCILGPKRSS